MKDLEKEKMSFAELQEMADELESDAIRYFVAGEADLAKFYHGASLGFMKRAEEMIIGEQV